MRLLEAVSFFGLLAVLGVMSIHPINSVDTALLMVYLRGNVPYGVLWTWMNFEWWTQQPYMLYVFAFESAVFSAQWVLAEAGRMPKGLVFANMYLALFLSAAHVQQEITVSVLAPFAVLSPLVVPFLLLEKFPVGWSWPPWASANWACGVAGECVDFVNHRLDIYYPSFWFRAALVAWVAACYLLWCRAHPDGRLARLSLAPGRLLMRAWRLIKNMVLG